MGLFGKTGNRPTATLRQGESGNGRPGRKCLWPENAMVVKFCEVVKLDFKLFTF